MFGSWDALSAELDIWSKGRKKATFWWRDDDLNEPSLALERLLSLRQRLDLPLTLATIPDNVDPVLSDYIDGCELVQHGVTHVSHAEKGEKKSEFPASRDLNEAKVQLLAGKARLEELFPNDFFAFFVPPWNRISAETLNLLPGLGFIGVSRFKSRQSACPFPAFAEVNTHIDPVNWRLDRSAYPEHVILSDIIQALKNRRLGKADILEPIGILTHHLMFDEPLWEITYKLLTFLENHEAVRFLTLRGAISLIDEMPDLPEYN
ncbi:polysaccharide deacetylase family protein [Sneathiella glossodoripedis]|uniref:polysaccharide deacetylase family protein n=1 Tax=Sneathiella glossodoripedis TaxID=418853 RepID=UPI000472255F|nr:polysaccharide deacetylase family protein [Sneathiella glossodoripedis]